MNQLRQGRRTRRLRRQVLGLAALYVFALAAVGLHDGQHAHRVCEHGQVVHDETWAGSPEAPRTGDCDAPKLDANPGELASGAEHEHEHCVTALPLASKQRAPRPLIAPLIPVASSMHGLHAAPRHPSSEPLYLLAPTQSPPLV